MTESNSAALRGALARAIKSHVDENGLNGVKAAALAGIANSRMSMILRGQVAKVSSDALADILGKLGYRLVDDGNEFALISKPKEKALPAIVAPVATEKFTDFDPDADRVVADE